MTERVEIVVPIIYISTFIMSFYGPNAKILGNIKLTLWHYQEVTDGVSYIGKLLLLFAIDLCSAIVNGILLWTTCKINIFKTLQMIQKELWLIMAIQEALVMMEVK